MSDKIHRSHQSPHSDLEKEFELERMVLFTDAVFAIAITLLVIDIKWPELPESLAGINLYKIFQPTILQFFAFGLSFFYIGRSWAIHLNMFRQLKKYDQGLINRNLLFLFFIVIFPFAAAGISGHVRGDMMMPVFLYAFNIACASVAHFILCRYIFYQRPALSIDAEADVKKYIYMRAKFDAIGMIAFFLVIVVIALVIPPGKNEYIGYGSAVTALLFVYTRRQSRKYKPKTDHA
jgi:uncharacterized membrane protein